MPKKKKPGHKAAKPDRASRKQSISAAEVGRAAKLLGNQAAQLTALATQMLEHQLGEIEIDGAGLLDRGVDEIDRYLDNVQKGILKGRREKDRSSM